jgi:hypothetical protein
MSRTVRRNASAVWRERLERYAGGQSSVAEFCRRERVSQPSFYRWRKLLGGASSRRGIQRDTWREREPRFLPVEIPASLLATGVRMELPGGATVCFPQDVPAEVLSAAIRAACVANGGQEERAC